MPGRRSQSRKRNTSSPPLRVSPKKSKPNRVKNNLPSNQVRDKAESRVGADLDPEIVSQTAPKTPVTKSRETLDIVPSQSPIMQDPDFAPQSQEPTGSSSDLDFGLSQSPPTISQPPPAIMCPMLFSSHMTMPHNMMPFQRDVAPGLSDQKYCADSPGCQSNTAAGDKST